MEESGSVLDGTRYDRTYPQIQKSQFYLLFQRLWDCIKLVSLLSG